MDISMFLFFNSFRFSFNRHPGIGNPAMWTREHDINQLDFPSLSNVHRSNSLTTVTQLYFFKLYDINSNLRLFLFKLCFLDSFQRAFFKTFKI